ncbi:MAG TPA: hypothetical protein VFC41_08050, partial [Anaerovoracaceae bacterium]|nr:hypothetical protein [Anaerovoracaceae bacterium]
YDNSLFSGLLFETSVKNLLTQRSVINLNSLIGQYYRFGINYLQFIDRNQKFGLSTNFYTDNVLLPMLELRGENGDVVSRNFTSGLSVNRRLGLNQLMNLSANVDIRNLIPNYVSDGNLKNISYNYISANYDYQVNTINSKHFPDNGTILNISVSTSKLLSGSIRTDISKLVYKEINHGGFSFDRFYTFYGNIKQYFSSGDKLTFAIGGNALLISEVDSVSARNNFYLLGGAESINKRSIPMIGFHPNEIPVKKLAGISTELDMELVKYLHINIMANIFAAREVNRDKGYSILTGYGVGAGYLSIFGPVKIGLMYGNYNHERYFRKIKGYISIGYNF